MSAGMVGLAAGLVLGANGGLLLAAILASAGRADRRAEEMRRRLPETDEGEDLAAYGGAYPRVEE